MKIGVMLRAVTEKQGTGLYATNMLKNLLKIDKNNQYVLFYQGKKIKTSFSDYPNVEEQWINVPYKILWDQIFIPFLAIKAHIDFLFSTKFTVPLVFPHKTVTVLHGTEWFVYPEFYKSWDVLYIKVMMPLYMRKATKVIAVSNKTKEDIVKFIGVSKSKVKVVYLAADDIFKEPVDRVFVRKIKTKYALPSQFILHVGVVYPGKNIEGLIQAFAKLTKKFPHKLILVGGFKWKYKEIFNLIEKLKLKDRIVMIRWVPHNELRVFYNLADLLVFPSFYEAFPVPPLEAMVCGCPVIVSSTGGLPEVVGDAALMVDPTSVDEIYRATVKILENESLKKKLINEGFNQVKKFSWEKNARETLSVFEELEEYR